MKISLIILTYNRPDALLLILKSIEKQTELPFEVLIADDGSTEETRNLLEVARTSFPVPLLHVYHSDLGYRIAKIRNQAVKKSRGDYFIFSDGDLIFHPRFVEDFRKNAKVGEALIGSRVFLTEKATTSLLKKEVTQFKFSFFSPGIEVNRMNAIRFPVIKSLFPLVKYSVRLRGGLLGIWKHDLVSVNGWNEDFVGWGLEDSELLARLNHRGIVFRKMKFRAITYHLWHKMLNRNQLSANRQLFETTLHQGLQECKNGLTPF